MNQILVIAILPFDRKYPKRFPPCIVALIAFTEKLKARGKLKEIKLYTDFGSRRTLQQHYFWKTSVM